MSNIYVIVGEASGDFIGSSIIQELSQDKNLKFFGIGGSLLAMKGVNSLFPMHQISLMGFLEILPHTFKLRALIKKTVQDILLKKIDLLITIDSPGFTYRVAREVRKTNKEIKMIHIVAPSVWAYRPARAKKYADVYDHLLAILPFEPPYFEKVGLKCTYIGHPFLAQSFYNDKNVLRAELDIKAGTKIICVTPGSRKGEIKRHMPILASSLKLIAKEYQNIEVIFVLNDLKHQSLIKEYLNFDFNFRFSNDKLRMFGVSDVAIAKSGTNTLEIASSNTPLVIAYKLNSLTFWLIKMIIKIRFACLINIVADKEIIPEFIQDNFKPEKITTTILELLENKDKAKQQLSEANKILIELGLGLSHNPAQKAAVAIRDLLDQGKR